MITARYVFIAINLLFFYVGSRINPASLKSFLWLHLTDCVAFTGEDNLSLIQFTHLNSYISIGILYIKSDDLHKLLRIVFGIQEPLRTPVPDSLLLPKWNLFLHKFPYLMTQKKERCLIRSKTEVTAVAENSAHHYNSQRPFPWATLALGSSLVPLMREFGSLCYPELVCVW